MSKLSALDFLETHDAELIRPWVVLHGSESFLVRESLRHLERLFASETDPPTQFDETAEWRDVRDELATRSLFGGGTPRMVVVSEADKFVSRYRDALEDDVQSGRKSGVLVLTVKTWTSTTRLAKAIGESGLTVECKPPTSGRSVDVKRITKWLQQRAKKTHGVKLDQQAASLLLELTDIEFGLLDQNLAKLAVCSEDGNVSPELVQSAVGGWSTKTAWDLIEAALSGRTGEALVQWDHLVQAGENPIGVFAQISYSLRQLAGATRIFQEAKANNRALRLRDALMEAGVKDWPPGKIRDAEQQLIRLGQARAGQLHRWLLDTDLALKGSHSNAHRARWCIEHLLLRIAECTR